MLFNRKGLSIVGAVFALAIGSLSLAQPAAASTADVSSPTASESIQGFTTPLAASELQAKAAGCGFNFAAQNYNHCTSDGSRVWISLAWNDSITGNSYTGQYCVGPGTTSMISLIGPFNWVYYASYAGYTC